MIINDALLTVDLTLKHPNITTFSVGPGLTSISPDVNDNNESKHTGLVKRSRNCGRLELPLHRNTGRKQDITDEALI